MVCVVGAGPGAGELLAARAVGSPVVAPWALGTGDGPAADEVAVPLPGAGTPLVAARHVGSELDPRRLAAAAADDGAVVALGGGPFAPLTPRYAVRDLARELGRPAVVAVGPSPGFPGLALGAVSGLRAAGVTVAGIAVTGWPDPPDRVALDERDVLAEVADVPVATLGAGAHLDVAPWLAAAAADGGDDGAFAPAPAVRDVALEPYRTWTEEPQGDPRETPRPRIMAALLAIVGAEGPMTAARAYAVYNRAAGGRKLTSVARAPLSSALYWLAREERVVLVRADEHPQLGEDLVRLPDAPAVRVRELGPRDLTEVPLDEIAELVRRLREARRLTRPDELKRAVLDRYGLVRMTARADEYLGRALEL